MYILDRQQWYTELFSYDMMMANIKMVVVVVVDASDPDHEVIPRLFSKIVQPVVKRLFINIWDPLSYKQGKTAAMILNELLVHLNLPPVLRYFNRCETSGPKIFAALNEMEGILRLPRPAGTYTSLLRAGSLDMTTCPSWRKRSNATASTGVGL